MSRPKNYNTEEMKESVCRAARKLFVQKGYFNTSIPDIVKESNVSTGAIYNHFISKQKLSKLLYDETMEMFLTRLEQKIQNKISLRDKLVAIIELLFELTEEDPIKMEYMMFVKHSEISGESVPICNAKPFHIIEQIISEGVKDGTLRNGNPEIIAASFISIPLKIIEMKINGVIKYPLKEIMPQIVDNCWNAIARM